MVNINNLSKYVLQELKDENINKDIAINIVKQLNEKDDIAVIGMACKNGSIDNYEDYWDIFANKFTNIRRAPKKRIRLISYTYKKKIGKFEYSKGSYIDDIDMFDNNLFNYSENEARYLSPGVRKALEVVYRALEDAGYLGEHLSDNKMGIFLGNNYVIDSLFSYIDLCNANPGEIDLFKTLLLNWSSGLSTRIANYFNFKGPSYAIDGSCASSTIAIHNACTALVNNQCTTAVAGGLLIDLGMTMKRDSKLKWAFFHDDNVITRIFDNNCGGAYMAEGLAFLVLKPLAKAIEDGDRIHGIISGWSLNNNGSNGDYTQTSAEDIKKSVMDSVKQSKVNPANIGFMLTEGYPQKLVEGLELAGIAEALNNLTPKKQFCALGSIAPNIGYMQSCIGTFNTMYALMALKKKKIPPLYHFINPTDTISFCNSAFYVNDVLQEWESEKDKERCAGVNSYGFGGINLFLILKEAQEQRISTCVKDKNLFILTAKTKYSLQDCIGKYISFLENNKDCSLTLLCANVNTRRNIADEYRLAVVASSLQDLHDKLVEFSSGIPKTDRIFYGDNSEKIDKNKKQRFSKTVNLSLEDIGREFCEGKNFIFSELYKDCDITFMEIPGYSFDRRSYWCEDFNKSPFKLLKGILGKEVRRIYAPMEKNE